MLTTKSIVLSKIMEIFLSFASNVSPTIFSLFMIFLCSFLWASRSILKNAIGKNKAPPEAGGAWPIIGHLHLLAGSKPPHIALGNMADIYGPIFTVKMGVHRSLVVSNSEMAKECLTTNDKAFATRPKSVAMEILGYQGAMIGFSSYCSYWRQMRKIMTLELLSNHRLEKLKSVREAEVKAFVKALYKCSTSSNKVLVDMKKWFGEISLNVILKIIVGKSVGYMSTDVEGESGGWKQVLREFFDVSGGFAVADALPFLRWLDIGGQEKAMKKTGKKLDLVVDAWLKEHKETRASRALMKGEGEDFMDLMLRILDDDTQVLLGRDADTINKATCLGLTLAASDTTTITLTWALSLLVNNPDVLKKIQLELDKHIGSEKQVNESDLKNLVYLKAVVKETLRLYPAAPLLIPHEAMESISIGDYHIPVGTRLFINVWKIQRDPRVWLNPCEFQPERFLSTHKEVDVRGQNFEFIPFASGRRMCPGVSFALQALELTLASLLHGFDFATPSGEPIDMTESIAITNLKATPLEVRVSPRLPSYLYD